MREKNSLYNEYREKREHTKELQTVNESEALDGKRRGKLRRQEIEIYYSFVGKVELPDA